LRLLRREVEVLVKKKHGDDYLKDRRARTELEGISRELKRLKTRVGVLEQRKAELIADLGKQRHRPCRRKRSAGHERADVQAP
jgi:hypothetical protein